MLENPVKSDESSERLQARDAWICLSLSLFLAVYAAVFTDSGSLAQAFEKWRQIVVPAGIEEGHYDKIFSLTTVLGFVTMSVPVLFLSWLATKVIMLGIKVVGVKE